MARLVVIGLDGATFRVVDPLIAEGQLPNLARLKEGGTSGVLWSTIHPYSAPAWTSFMTGANPGKHGLFDFFHHDLGAYRLNFVNASHRRRESLWRTLSRHGLRVGVMNVPLTYPAEEVNGFLIAGMDTPGKESNFIYPRSLLAELEERFGPYTIELSVRDYLRRGRWEEFVADLEALIIRQTRWAQYLLAREPWDFFITVFRASDQVQHFFWRFMDPGHPYHRDGAPARLREAVANVYRGLDAAIGEIASAAGSQARLLVMSDHGQGPSGNRALYLNKWLRTKGLLRFKQEGSGPAGGKELASRAVDGLKKALPRGFKDFLLRRFPRLRDQVETMLSFADIDFGHTLAYSEDVRANIWINLKGRQPQGQVEPQDYEGLRERIISHLSQERDPVSGAPLAEMVYRREDLYAGDHVSQAPDIVFVQPEGYPPMLRRSRTDRDLAAWAETIPESELGVWPTAHHTPDGLYLLAGEGVRPANRAEARIIDLAPTILYLLGLPVPADMDGAVLTAALKPSFLSQHPLGEGAAAARQPVEPGQAGYSEEEEAAIEERLKGLGYLE